MTITWPSDRITQKVVVSGLLDKLYQSQDLAIPGTYIGNTAPTDAQLITAWQQKAGIANQPSLGSPVQWFDSDLGLIRDHYSKIPEDGVLSSGIYHQHSPVPAIPYSKYIGSYYGNGVDTVGRVENIPASYYDLIIIAQALSTTRAANVSAIWGIRPNGYAVSNYVGYYWGQPGTGAVDQSVTTATYMSIMRGLSQATNQYPTGSITRIHDYAANRFPRSIWLSWDSEIFSVTDDALLGSDFNLYHIGGRSGVIPVMADGDYLDFVSATGAWDIGTVISVYAVDPVL